MRPSRFRARPIIGCGGLPLPPCKRGRTKKEAGKGEGPQTGRAQREHECGLASRTGAFAATIRIRAFARLASTGSTVMKFLHGTTPAGAQRASEPGVRDAVRTPHRRGYAPWVPAVENSVGEPL